MAKPTHKLYFVFAGWTFLAISIVAASVTILQIQGIRSQAEADATAAVDRTVLPVLDLDAEDVSAGDFEGFYESAGALLGREDVQAIRVWSGDGELLAEAGRGQGAAADVDAVLSASQSGSATRKAGSPNGDVLANYVRFGDSTVIEIQQDYGPIAESVATSRWRLALIAFGGTIVTMILLQTILWAAARGMRGEYNRLDYLHRSGQAMRSTLDVTGVLERLTRDTARYVGAHLGLATLLEDDGNELILRASYEQRDGSTVQHYRAVDVWYMRRCAVTGETVFSADEDFPYQEVLGHEIDENRQTSILNVAIPGRDGAIGVVTLVRGVTRRAFSKADVQMIEELATQGGLAVEQVALFTKVRNHADALELSYDSTLRVLMAALDTKDAVTQGHSERVGRLTVTLAKEMGVPEERLSDMERGALLHDVGKIGVPDAVLQKPSSLDAAEWEAMEKHPLNAGLMLSKLSFLEGAMPIVLYHHERYDGTGYPFKLKRNAIPFEARIFAVVDAYDAMTFDRPYRKAMSSADALRELERHSGKQFDPAVVEAFGKLIRRMHGSVEEAA
ncbi:MAG: HD domain-containing protein [Chloroflexi bacterium]|nr:HD domain-containing protein [Chloroflexota bacterium]